MRVFTLATLRSGTAECYGLAVSGSVLVCLFGCSLRPSAHDSCSAIHQENLFQEHWNHHPSFDGLVLSTNIDPVFFHATRQIILSDSFHHSTLSMMNSDKDPIFSLRNANLFTY